MLALRAMVTAANDGMWDRAYGIQTAGKLYTPTAYRVLFKLFTAMELAPGDRFVDFGCGKGRVMCLASRYRVARVTGVELDPLAAEAARRNLETLRGRKANDCSVTTGSAADFDCSGGTVFYFYNPFGGPLFAEVIGKVREAAANASVPVRVVYVNPVCREVLDGADWLGPAEVLHHDRAGKPAALLYRARKR